MKRMTRRERFEAAVNHKEIDRVPLDLCGTSLTGIEHKVTFERLKEFLGIEGRYDGWYDKCDERILKHLDTDFRWVGEILEPQNNFHGMTSQNELIDCWGVKRVFTGLYWDIKEYPLKGAKVDDLDKYPWPRADAVDMKKIEEFREMAKKLYNETDYVVCAEHPTFGILELGCWMCGYDEFLYKMAAEPEFVEKFFSIILNYQKQVIEIYYGALGDYIHFTTSGDDFGMQTGPMISPAMFSKFVKPYFKERISYTKKFTRAYYCHHTCGSVYELIPHLVEAGVDILNPIQPGAKGMEPERLKKDFGDTLTFHGGIDTQDVLCRGTAADVKKEVHTVLNAMGGSGGYILAPAHNIQPDVPPENVAAIYEAAKDFFSFP